MTEDEALSWLEARSTTVPGYWLDSTDWPSGAWRHGVFLLCETHARRGARLLRHLRAVAGVRPPYGSFGREAVSATQCWAGDDSVEVCDICGVPLDTGGLSDYGVRELFDGLSPHDAGPSVDELLAMHRAMPRERLPQWLALVTALVADAP